MRYLLVSFVHFSWPIVLIAPLFFHAVFPDIQDYHKNPPFVTFKCFSAKDGGEISRLCGGFGGHINSFRL